MSNGFDLSDDIYSSALVTCKTLSKSGYDTERHTRPNQYLICMPVYTQCHVGAEVNHGRKELYHIIVSVD